MLSKKIENVVTENLEILIFFMPFAISSRALKKIKASNKQQGILVCSLANKLFTD